MNKDKVRDSGLRWLTPPQVCEYLSISRSSLERMLTSEELPRPKRMGERMIRFDRHKIDEFMENKEDDTGEAHDN